MQVTETLSEGLKRGYTVIVPAADIEGRRTAKLSELGKSLRLPGFRPGKVPLPVVRQRYGTAVAAEVLEESVNEATQQVLSERGLRAATQPKVDVVSAAEAQGRDLEFKVEVELLPEITMPEFAGIHLTRLKAKPADEAIDRALGEIAQRQRELVEVTEDRGAEAGEVLTVDFAGTIDGTAFPGGAGTDVAVEVAGPGFIPGFTEQVVGMKSGETRTIQVTFPEDYHAKEVAGKPAGFEIVAKALRHPVVPPIDDALATKVGFESLAALRDVLVAQMQREYDQLARLRLKRELLDELAKQVSFPAPDGMVQAEFDQIWQRVEADLKAGKADEEDRRKDEETLKAEYRGISERRVKLGLLLAEIGRSNGITVAADEMTRAMRAEAARYRGQEAQVMEFFRKNAQAAESLRGPIFEDKVIDFILELAQVEEKEVAPEALNTPDEAEAQAGETATAEAAAPVSAP
jgi:trigger factor